MSNLIESLHEMDRLQAECMRRVESMVEILLGDISEKRPKTLEDFFRQNGIQQEEVDRMSAMDKAERASTLLKSRKPKHFSNLIAALDLIFEARYGWPPGTAADQTSMESFIALEHAMEYDASGKPSVWDCCRPSVVEK